MCPLVSSIHSQDLRSSYADECRKFHHSKRLCVYFDFFQEAGDLLFGVSYLPTAQRLSVSVIRARNLKYLQIVDSIANFS